jgi:transketolase
MNTQVTVSDSDIRDAFFDEVYTIASKDPNVMFLTADMGAFSLIKFKEDLSSQYINVGVAEQSLVSIAAGLALGGKKVFIYTIAPFVTQRCYEQIKVDLSQMRLPVTIIGSGPGITYGCDGPTHHAVQDIAIMRALPEMTILNPSDPVTAAAAAKISYKNDGPVYVRIDKGKLPLLYDNEEDFSDGLALLKEGRDLTIITTGVMVHQAFKVADELAKHSIDAGIIDLYRIKPINEELLLAFIEQSNRIITLEEHSIIGGIGSAISEILVDNGKVIPMKRIAIADKNCIGYGDRVWMHSYYGLDMNSITKTILNWLQTGGGFIRTPGQSTNDISSDDCTYSELTVEDFGRLFGTTVDDISDDCRELIFKIDFRYKKFSSGERDKIILRILKTIDSDSLSIVGPHRKSVWENGWSENLRNFVDSNFDLNVLIPKFVKRNEVIRLNGNYIMPTNLDFETRFVEVLRTYLFRKYFSDASAVYEFGCGTGLNLVKLAKLFPEKKLYGLDWSDASCDIVNKIAISQNLNLTGILFDMYSPDYQLDIDKGNAVFTIGAMEQLGKNFESFLQFLLEKKPSICINIETIYELYDQRVLFDYVAAKYLERRGYLQGYLSRLRQLEVEGKIEIIKIQRTFGSLYHDGYSYIVWKPKA